MKKIVMVFILLASFISRAEASTNYERVVAQFLQMKDYVKAHETIVEWLDEEPKSKSAKALLKRYKKQMAQAYIYAAQQLANGANIDDAYEALKRAKTLNKKAVTWSAMHAYVTMKEVTTDTTFRKYPTIVQKGDWNSEQMLMGLAMAKEQPFDDDWRVAVGGTLALVASLTSEAKLKWDKSELDDLLDTIEDEQERLADESGKVTKQKNYKTMKKALPLLAKVVRLKYEVADLQDERIDVIDEMIDATEELLESEREESFLAIWDSYNVNELTAELKTLEKQITKKTKSHKKAVKKWNGVAQQFQLVRS